jgi:hypothetical protein
LDVLVFKNMAQKLIEKGLEDTKNITFKIHKRNFERK